MAQVHLSANTWWEGRPGMWRPGPAHRCHSTQCDRRRWAVCRHSVSSHTRTLAHMLAQLYDGTDFRPSRNGDGVAPAATHRLRECGRAMTRRPGQFTDLRYPVTPTLAHKLARAFDGQVFDHPKTVMGLRRLARTVCEGVTARWRDGVESFPTFGIQSHRCLHACWRGRSMEQIFDH